LNSGTGDIYYKPISRENMVTANVVVPVLETLISGSGSLDNKLKNIKFEGITFAYAGWTRPNNNDGFADVQANFHLVGPGGIFNIPSTKIAANIDFKNAKSIKFERNVFTHLGAGGLNFGEGSQDNIVSGNVFNDISGNGIMIGETSNAKTTDQRIITKNNQITNNYIQDAAAEYMGGVGIWLGYTENSLVAHNELAYLPYTAVSLGWGWGAEDPTIAKNNKVQNNYIHDHMQKLFDGGGIYSLSAQPGNIYSGNVITKQKNEFGAIYLDDGSWNIEVSSNVIYDNKRTFNAKGGSHKIHDNWWQVRGINDVTFINRMTCGPGRNEYCGDNTIENNYPINSLDEAPKSIMDNAGLEDAYKGIKTGILPPKKEKTLRVENTQSRCSDSGNRVTVSWDRNDIATSYLLRIDDTTNNNDPNVQSGWYVDGSTDLGAEISSPTFTHNILPNKFYKWWVHGNNQYGYGEANGGEFNCQSNNLLSSVCSALLPYKDSLQDASSVLQKCINDAPANGVVEIPPGKYSIGKQIVISGKPITLKTQGKTEGMPRCSYENNHDCAELSASTSLTCAYLGMLFVDAEGTKIQHIVLNGNREQRWSLLCSSVDHPGANAHILCSNCAFVKSVSKYAASSSGLVMGRFGKTNIIVNDNAFVFNGYHRRDVNENRWADGLTFADGAYSTITNNLFIDNTDINFVLGGCAHCTIKNNQIMHTANPDSWSWGGMMVHSWPSATSGDYTGTEISNNVIDCNPAKNCEFGLLVGADRWYASMTFGGSVHDNTIKYAQKPLVVNDQTRVHDFDVYDNTIFPAESAICGNLIKEQGEECDGASLGGQTCNSKGFSGGILRCIPCRFFDVSGCIQ